MYSEYIPPIFLFHGTNKCNIDSIKKNGLTGKIDDILFNKIIKVYSLIKHDKDYNDTYIGDFIRRQLNIRVEGKTEIYFTKDLKVAGEFSKGRRMYGEGLSYLYSMLLKLKDKYKDNKDFKDLYLDLEKIVTTCVEGIVLAIDINKLKKDNIINDREYKMYETASKTAYEIIIRKPIPTKYIIVYDGLLNTYLTHKKFKESEPEPEPELNYTVIEHNSNKYVDFGFDPPFQLINKEEVFISDKNVAKLKLTRINPESKFYKSDYVPELIFSYF